MLLALPLAPLIAEGAGAIALGLIGSAVYLARDLYGFRRSELLPPITGAEKEATHKEMVADVIAGAKVPVANPPPPPFQFGPVWLPASVAKAIDWGQQNATMPSNYEEPFLAIVNSTSSPADLYYEVYWEPWASVETPPNIYLEPDIGNAFGYGYMFPKGAFNHSDTIRNVQPGATPASANFYYQYQDFGDVQKWGDWGIDIPGAMIPNIRIYVKDNNALIQAVTLYGDDKISFEYVQPETTPQRKIVPGFLPSAPNALPLPEPLPAKSVPAVGMGTVVLPGTAANPKEDARALPQIPPATAPKPIVLPVNPDVEFDAAGLPLPQVAPAVKPTPVTDHIVGDLKIPARAPQATMQGIAEEVGRIEQKLSIMLNPGDLKDKIDWMKLFLDIKELLQASTSGSVYQLSSPCELDANGNRIIKEAAYSGDLSYMAVISNKIDALAQLIQHSKDLKQPACIPPIPRSTVTVTAYEVMES